MIQAIVYTSNTGFTAQYTAMLGQKTGLPVYTLAEAKGKLASGAEILYLGWLFAGIVRGYRAANKRFKVRAVCGVGLCDTGCLLEEIRKTNAVPATCPVFSMQGGIALSKLKGLNRHMIHFLTKGMAAKKTRSQDDERMLYLLTHEASYVCEENLSAVLDWYRTLT